jgi:hypothetical protein
VAKFGHLVAVRDSKNPAGLALTISPVTWVSFVTTLKRDMIAEHLSL